MNNTKLSIWQGVQADTCFLLKWSESVMMCRVTFSAHFACDSSSSAVIMYNVIAFSYFYIAVLTLYSIECLHLGELIENCFT